MKSSRLQRQDRRHRLVLACSLGLFTGVWAVIVIAAAVFLLTQAYYAVQYLS